MAIQRYDGNQWQSAEWPSYTSRPAESSSLTGNLVAPLVVGAGIFGSGFLPNKGGNLWDTYVKNLQRIEEYSPGGIFRTFQLSNFFSQFQSVPQAGLFLSPELMAQNAHYRSYLGHLIGPSAQGQETHNRLIAEGVTLKNNQLFWGQGEEIALKHASAFRQADSVMSRLGAGYAQALGWNPEKISREHFFSKLEPFDGILNPSIQNEPIQIIGGHNFGQHLYRQTSAIGAEAVNRFNRLLEAPFELEPFKTIFSGADDLLEKHTGTRLKFAVDQTTPLKMLGKLSFKYGVLGGGVALGYQSLDWLTRINPLFDQTFLSEGLTAGVATLGVKANLLASKVAEMTGLHAYREKQEEVAPGSTSLQKLLAFPLIGATFGATAAYLAKPLGMAKLERQGLSPSAARQSVVEDLAQFKDNSPLGRLGLQVTGKDGIYARRDWLGDVWRKIATVDEANELQFKFLGKIGPAKLTALTFGAIGAGLTLPFLPGALVPSTRPDELERIYSGEQEIAVRKGRFWSLGRSPYEGERIKYYRPHWYPRMIQRSKEKAIWGEDEESYSPIGKWFRKEFTYDLEQRHYEDMPFPVTALPFADVPLIGGLLSNTLGRIIKPQQYMHEEEWMGPGGSTLTTPPTYGQRQPATELGELSPMQPISPGSASAVVSEQMYRMTEMAGLPGFVFSSIKEKYTGSPDLFDTEMRLESANRIAGFERDFWDLELGDMLGTNEVFRRMYPHKQNQVPLYNPIKNQMPSWLPGSGEKGPDLQHGNAFSKIPEGEMRLPGIGYAARFPELKGVNPEDYPLIHKYKILSDVAPYTRQFKQHSRMVAAASKKGTLSPEEEAIYQQVQNQLQEKRKGEEFSPYQYLSPLGIPGGDKTFYRAGADDSTGLLTELNEMRMQGTEKPSLWKKFYGGYWEVLSHNAESAFDQLTPISPGAKFVHQRSPIEAYEREQLYGTQNSFWNRPYENFIRPFASTIAATVGATGVPSPVQHRRDLEEYFDVLKYAKAARLSNQAAIAGDFASLKEQEVNKNKTLFGLNPYDNNYATLFAALPRASKDYYEAFSNASTVEERERILEMVPENEKNLYKAKWQQQFAMDLVTAKEKGLLSSSQSQAADEAVMNLQTSAATEGQPHSKELFAEYLQTQLPNENYADWYRRTKLLSKYTLPGADWIGWDARVDLDDIKLKVIQNMGENMHDFNLWADRARSLANKPFINELAIQPITSPERLTESEKQARINTVLLTSEMQARSRKIKNVRINIEQDRQYSRD